MSRLAISIISAGSALTILLAALGWFGWHQLRTAASDIAPTISQIQPAVVDAAPGSLVLSGGDTLATLERIAGLKLPSELGGDSTVVFEGAAMQRGSGKWPAPSGFIGSVGTFGGAVRPTIIRLVRGTVRDSQQPLGKLVIRGTALRYNVVSGSVADTVR